MGISPSMAGRTVTCPACLEQVQVVDGILLPSTNHRSRAVHRSLAPGASGSAAESSDRESGNDHFTVHRRRAPRDEMDLTPMVDMTFLLLIFFMITASFSVQHTLEVPPPNPETRGASPLPKEQLEQNSVMVRVEAGDRFYVDEQPVAAADLAVALAAAMAEGTRTELVIDAEDDARHESVVEVYDAANDAGMQRIRIAVPAGGS